MTNSCESWTLVSNFLCYINRPLIKAILNWKHLNKISGLIAEETAVPSNAYYFAVIFSLATRLKKICRSNMVTIARWLKEKYVSKHCLCMFLITWPLVIIRWQGHVIWNGALLPPSGRQPASAAVQSEHFQQMWTFDGNSFILQPFHNSKT